MKTLKWFGQNLCLTNEEWNNTNLEKVVSGSELCKYLSKLNNYTWYKNRTEKNWKYVMGRGRIYYMDDAEFWRNIHSQTGIFNLDNDFYKVRIKKTKDGKEWSLEEDGVNALYWIHVPDKYIFTPKKKKHRRSRKMIRKKVDNTNLIYRLLTRKTFNQNELCQLIKEMAQFINYEYTWNYNNIIWTLPGKFFIHGKEYSEIKIETPDTFFDWRSHENSVHWCEDNKFRIARSSNTKPALELVTGGWYYKG